MLLARDGSLAAVHLPPALLSVPLQAPATTSTADLTASPVDLTGSAPAGGRTPAHGCTGCSLEYLPGVGLVVASLRAADSAWLLFGRPVSGASFLADITVGVQHPMQVSTDSHPPGRRKLSVPDSAVGIAV